RLLFLLRCSSCRPALAPLRLRDLDPLYFRVVVNHEPHRVASMESFVDGFKHHDRTAEQAERDGARDRALVAAGWVALRFTVREVLRDADACARQVLRFLRRPRSCTE